MLKCVFSKSANFCLLNHGYFGKYLEIQWKPVINLTDIRTFSLKRFYTFLYYFTLY